MRYIVCLLGGFASCLAEGLQGRPFGQFRRAVTIVRYTVCLLGGIASSLAEGLQGRPFGQFRRAVTIVNIQSVCSAVSQAV
ncbi:MAG: hypothetical protein ACI4JZ_05185 [Oscillospiraceae bacterium]